MSLMIFKFLLFIDGRGTKVGSSYTQPQARGVFYINIAPLGLAKGNAPFCINTAPLGLTLKLGY